MSSDEIMCTLSQGLGLGGRESACNQKIAGAILVYGRFATPFCKEFKLTMRTIVAQTVALLAAWGKIS